MTGCCESGNEPLGSIKFGVFLNYLRTVDFTGRTLLHGVIIYFVGFNLFQRFNATRIYLLVAKIKQKTAICVSAARFLISHFRKNQHLIVSSEQSEYHAARCLLHLEISRKMILMVFRGPLTYANV